MKLGDMFKKSGHVPMGSSENKPEVPDGLLKKCNKCKAAIYTK